MVGCSIDFRFVCPPMINICLLILSSSSSSSSGLLLSLQNLLLQQQPTTLLILAVVAASVVLLLLYASVKIRLSLSSVYLRFGDFSGPLTLSLLLSVIFPPFLFWIFFLFILATSPWYDMLANLIRSFFRWIHRSLQSNPLYPIIDCSSTHHEYNSPATEEPVSTPIIIEIEENIAGATSRRAGDDNTQSSREPSPPAMVRVGATTTMQQDQHLQVVMLPAAQVTNGGAS